MKTERQDLILSIIKNEEIETQEILRERLCEAGFDVTQATVSRDISELGLIKGMSVNGVSSYTIPQKALTDFDEIFRQAVLRFECVGNFVVIKCKTGLANAACASLDSMEIDGIAGTVAGDDTIFTLFREEKSAVDFGKKLKAHLL